MALVVDSRFKLNFKIGNAVHNLPIYEDYSEFYNGMYFPLKVSTGNRYVPITPTQSELTINAGTIKDGKKYYFLTRAFTYFFILCTFKTAYKKYFLHPTYHLAWSCPRPISISQLHTLLYFHL